MIYPPPSQPPSRGPIAPLPLSGQAHFSEAKRQGPVAGLSGLWGGPGTAAALLMSLERALRPRCVTPPHIRLGLTIAILASMARVQLTGRLETGLGGVKP